MKTLEEMRQFHSEWSNHMGGIGIGWDEAPYVSLDYPEIKLEKNMTQSYHVQFWIDDPELGRCVCIENTYRVIDTGWEIMGKWPYKELWVVWR